MRAALLLTSAAFFAAPLAQAQTVSNDQFDLRGASSEMSIATDSALDVGVTSVAGANAYAVSGPNVALDNLQHADGDVTATNTASIGSAGGVVVVTSAAVANGVTSATQNGGMDVRSTQLSHANQTASVVNDTGYVGHSASSASASGNVAALSAANGDISAALTQESAGSLLASTEADHWGSDGQVVADAIASANNISATGSTTTLLTDTTQNSGGGQVTAEVELYVGHAADAVGNATANANALTIDNEFGYVNTRAVQENTASVEARAYVTLGGDFAGFASAGAYGVGNSAIVSNTTSDTVLDISQNNVGDISANVGLVTEGAGDQALASSAAYGNVVTGSLCGQQCGDGQATLNANNTQINSGAVHASAAIHAREANTIAGTATAIGNAATYQSTGPGG